MRSHEIPSESIRAYPTEGLLEIKLTYTIDGDGLHFLALPDSNSVFRKRIYCLRAAISALPPRLISAQANGSETL
jgi:hypothetical protein